MDAPSERALLSEAWGICDDAWKELQRRPYVQARLRGTPSSLPDVSFAEAERRSALGRALLGRLGHLDSFTAPHDLALTLRLVTFLARVWSREAEWYWTVIDPLGCGSFGLFLPTAYCGGRLLNVVKTQLGEFDFATTADVDTYLSLVSGYATLIDQLAQRTQGQAQRGVRIPKVQVLQARKLLSFFRAGIHEATGVSSQRLPTGVRAICSEIQCLITTCIEPAFDRAMEGLSDQYLEKAPDTVGMDQYPGGREVYAELVRLHTTLDLLPEQVHAYGQQRMADIERAMLAAQAELGFEGDDDGYRRHLTDDPRWRAATENAVTAVFQRYIDRAKPKIEESFSLLPKASYAVAPLPKALEGSMTYGYYDAPRNDRASGLYMFNAKNLTMQPLWRLATLTYHELMPGHHLQIAAQQENTNLHPVRTHSFINAYMEGWAEYAAALAGEIDLYAQPEERYGRLAMDAFFTSRLVVDTGMNALGWSLERARAYMRKHARLSESEVLTESVRYSCDIPAQSLAYRLGDQHILRLRERMRRALGDRFDLKKFHAVILETGAVPLPDLEWHVEHQVEALRAHFSWPTIRSSGQADPMVK